MVLLINDSTYYNEPNQLNFSYFCHAYSIKHQNFFLLISVYGCIYMYYILVFCFYDFVSPSSS